MNVDDELLDLLVRERRLEQTRQAIAADRLLFLREYVAQGHRYKDLMALLGVSQSRASQLISAARRA